MMRGNSAARRFVLLLAMLSVIGIAFGCLADDMLPGSGPFADDPAFPVPTGGLVLVVPARPPLISAVIIASSLISAVAPVRKAHLESAFVRVSALLATGFTLPQRC